MLTEEQVKEFQEIYKKQFGVEINSEEALEKGIKLINLLEILVSKSVDKK